MNDSMSTDKIQNIDHAGFDLGNWGAKVCIRGLVSKIPAGYSFTEPERYNPKTGFLTRPKAFSLRIGNENLWFGDDALSSPSFESKLDESKLSPEYISTIFLGCLYKWAIQHREGLGELGRLKVVASMPPRFYQFAPQRAAFMNAYKAAFTRKQPLWLKIPGKPSQQILTKFGGIQPESTPPNLMGFVLVVDIGYGTDDYCFLQDGEIKAVKTNQNGLLHAFVEMDEINHHQLELDLLQNKKGLPVAIKAHFGKIQQRILTYTRALNKAPEKVIIMGGGATLIKANPATRSLFNKYLPFKTVTFQDEFSNCRNNYLKAGGKK